MRMFLFFNEENLQFLEMALTSEVNNNVLNYMNFIMAGIYRVMFQNKLPRVLPEMEDVLQFALDRRMGDWVLLKEHTIIRVYGFVHELYILPAFLTPRIFSLEFIRKKLIVENEHFINFRKASEIKFPGKLGHLSLKIRLHFLWLKVFSKK